MRQDRRLNGWVLLGSIIQIIASIIAVVAGAGLAVVGFLYKDKLAKLTDLTMFTGHLSDLQDKFFDKHLITKYLYLFLGAAVAVIGLIALILAIVSLFYAKKRKVVRRRAALLVFSLIPLAVVGGVVYYYVLKHKVLTDNIKYVAYGLIGAFGVPALFNILGVMFGRSEKFMSNDNGKYAFNNSSLRNARADANNNVRAAQMQYPAQANQGEYAPMDQARPVQPQATARPVQPMQRPAQQGARPGQPMQRPVQPGARPAQPGMRPSQPMQRPVQPGMRQGQPMQRPVQPGARPAQPMQRPSQPGVRAQRFCNKCGKMLSPNEMVCSLCGTKVNN